MKTSLLRVLCAAALFSTPVFSEDGDPLRGKLKDLEERARTAKEQGRADEARELMEQVQRLHAEIGKREGPRASGDRLGMAKHQIEELHKAGKHEEAEQLAHRLREAEEQQGKRKEGGDEVERKQHVMEAIKHLHAAGMHEPAERIEQMLREPRESTVRRGPEHAAPSEGQEQLQRAIRDIQEQTQRAMRDMQEQTQRALRDTHEQMAKMARVIDELREQTSKPRGDGERRKDRD